MQESEYFLVILGNFVGFQQIIIMVIQFFVISVGKFLRKIVVLIVFWREIWREKLWNLIFK